MNRRAFLNPLIPNSGLAVYPQVAGGLEPYVPSTAMPWDRSRASHLLRRTGFGASPRQLEALLKLSPAAAVKQIIDEALARPLPPTPSWANTGYPATGATQAELDTYTTNARNWLYEAQRDWVKEMLVGGLREKMTLFWSNHVVTEYNTYNNNGPYGYQYLTLLRRNALGNFKTLIKEVGMLPAMLFYLNGRENRKGAPNENYARELLELFTLGRDNGYTQTDIVETAKALTGWQVNNQTLSSVFNQTRFETADKTIFGQKGAWKYEDVINLIFTQRISHVALYICRKLYTFFVYQTPNDTIVAQLAQTFIANSFELTPVLRQLLGSAHFFESTFIGAKIKSPLELALGFISELGQTAFTDTHYTTLTRTYLNRLGQMVLDPPNVAGWPGHRDWISSTFLTARWQLTDLLALGDRNTPAAPIKAYAQTLSTVGNPYDLAYDLANRMMVIPLPSTMRQSLGATLLAGVPDYEWDINATNSETKLRNYLRYLCRLPEYQLT